MNLCKYLYFEDFQRLTSDEEIGKRPLSKLIKDISEELGLLK